MHSTEEFPIPDQPRRDITSEPSPAPDHHDPRHTDVEWVGHRQQGHVEVPADFTWTSNPKQQQDDASCGG